MKGGIPSLIHIHKSLDSRRALILAALPSSSVIGCAGGRIRQAAWNFSALFSFPPPLPLGRPPAHHVPIYLRLVCMPMSWTIFPHYGTTLYMGVPPTIYNSTHSRRQHKRKKKKKKMQLPESHPSVVSAPCSAELSDKGRLCDSFYFFSLAVLPLLLLLLRYIHSTHSIWNADESPSSIHRRRDCIHKYTEPPSSFSCVSFGR